MGVPWLASSGIEMSRYDSLPEGDSNRQESNRRMSLFRPDVDRLHAYIPGEQPQERGWVKLNTNENPYPPSPRVVEAIQEAATGRLNVYPEPVAAPFREAAAKVLGVEPDWILPANGSDENLTIIIRSFADAGDLISFPYPSYVLYKTLAEIQGARFQHIPLQPDWSWNPDGLEQVRSESRIVFVPNPNSPSGTNWSAEEIGRLQPDRGVLILDEAYGDFREPSLQTVPSEAVESGRVIMTRTFSKSYSLAGLRFGFAVAHPDLIRGMLKVKDSYNCDAISIAAATAAINDQEWMQSNVEKIRQTRQRLFDELSSMGFKAEPSQANFVWATHPEMSHQAIYETLKERKILIRFMQFPLLEDNESWQVTNGLRITVGTDEECDRLLEELRSIV